MKMSELTPGQSYAVCTKRWADLNAYQRVSHSSLYRFLGMTEHWRSSTPMARMIMVDDETGEPRERATELRVSLGHIRGDEAFYREVQKEGTAMAKSLAAALERRATEQAESYARNLARLEALAEQFEDAEVVVSYGGGMALVVEGDRVAYLNADGRIKANDSMMDVLFSLAGV
jgi:hypothetical protein